MAESATSSTNRRAFKVITNCSAQLYSTRSMITAGGFHWKAERGRQKRTASSLVSVSEASKAS